MDAHGPGPSPPAKARPAPPWTATSAPRIEHHDAPRRLANRLAGILPGYRKTRDLYDEAIAWYHREDKKPAS